MGAQQRLVRTQRIEREFQRLVVQCHANPTSRPLHIVVRHGLLHSLCGVRRGDAAQHLPQRTVLGRGREQLAGALLDAVQKQQLDRIGDNACTVM